MEQRSLPDLTQFYALGMALGWKQDLVRSLAAWRIRRTGENKAIAPSHVPMHVRGVT
jgi:hypothetical protein